MVLLLGLSVAAASPRATYRAGNIVGASGAGLMVAGGVVGFLTVPLLGCPPVSTDCGAYHPFLLMLPGLLVMEVGAPIALAGALAESRERSEGVGWRVPDTLGVAGLVAYAGQWVISPLLGLPAAYILAHEQHVANLEARPRISLQVVPMGGRGVALRGEF